MSQGNEPRAAGGGPRVAPHSREAEESVLGAVLLSSDAANVALERLRPEDFYTPVHQVVYEAVRDLYDGNQPIDAVTVNELLRRRGTLDRVGGVGFLTGLLESVPTVSNVEYYVGIVEEHATRRRLLRAGGRVGDLAGQIDQPIHDILDQAEQTVFGVSERRVGEGLEPIDPLLGRVIERAEELHTLGKDITGLSTGFRDLDLKLAGLHPTNLVIIAARPGMGKTALALNMASNIAIGDEPVAVFTLEMSRDEIVSRLLCAQGRIDSQRLRTGRLTEVDFTKLSKAASALYKKPLFVDDSPGLTVTEIRAKCRRLAARRHGLSLVVVDYLQLMHSPGGSENRQQEIATISRNLKNLARELKVPVLAVSQLNRSLESREDKRPRLGDLRECLAGDTPVWRADTGGVVTIGDIARGGLRNLPVWSLDGSGRLQRAAMAEAWSTGVKPLLELVTASGRRLRATANHPLLTPEGWLPLGAVRPGDRIAVPHRLPVTVPVGGARAEPASAASAHPGPAPQRSAVATAVPAGPDLEFPSADARWDRVAAVRPGGIEEVFDARVPGLHNFVAGGVVVHNSGAIEQDADVVMFIYRHEYYHPEAQEVKGIAEVNIAKHRSGAVGRIEMTFQPEFTRFSDMGRDTPLV